MRILLTLLLLLISQNLNGSHSASSDNPCLVLETCAECTQNPDCAWCSQSDFHGQNKRPLPRCNTIDAHAQLGGFQCDPNQLFYHKNFLGILRNESLTERDNEGKRAVPIQPQQISIKIRPLDPVTFEMRYKEVEDYPLDLYYLMDGTYTMKDDKEVLVGLGDSIGQRIRSLTTKYRQGFGTFVDKVTMPYVSMIPEFLENPCFIRNDTCVRPYSFKNHMKLSNDTVKFSQTVDKVVLSGSMDMPEGGLDALMQVMVCEDQIGWSEQARRLIIYASDAPFHYAGDGWLGGVILPNDGHCHLDKAGEYYTHDLIFDYPSMAQINAKAKERSINIIFAVTADHIDDYNRLQGVIEGSKSTELAKNSSNIVDLVEDEYKRIKSRVEIKDNFPSEFFQVRYFSRCLDGVGSEESERNYCEDLQAGMALQFRVEIKLLKCSSRREEWKQRYRIYAVGVPDSTDVDVETLCDCPCEKSENSIPKSPLCRYHGTESCGLCECEENYFGKFCECHANERKGKDAFTSCKRDNDTTEVCSGRGNCICGECVCFNVVRYSGAFCECDNQNCPLINDQLCDGHGTCDCGVCKCDTGFEGAGCDCSTSKDTCFEPGETLECSGQGSCVCGKCQCRGKYSGEFCEKCLHESCPTKCKELKHCVQCRIFGTGVLNPADCDLNCYQHSIQAVDAVTVIPGSGETLCKFEDPADDCVVIFGYKKGRDKRFLIQGQRTKECPPQAPIFWILTSIASIVVLAGLILLCAFRWYRKLQIKKEYAAYERDRANAVWRNEINPIYTSPIDTFENPMYSGKDK